MAAAELASIVAAYLRKHGFSKTLAAFFRESGDTPEEKDTVDLEMLYKLYISTLVNEDAKTKKSKKTKSEDMLEMVKVNENLRDNAEEKVNGGASSEKKKKTKREKENFVVSLIVPKSEFKNIPMEKGSKKKKEENRERDETIEGLEPKVENCLTVAGTLKPSGNAGCDSALNKIVGGIHVENGGGLATKQEDAHPPKSLSKRSKKEKEQEGEELAGSETPLLLADNTQVSSQEDGFSKKKRKNSRDADGEETKNAIATESACTQVSSQEDGLPKKKRKKSKDAGGEETKDAIATESACKTPINGQTEKLDAVKKPVELLGEPGGCGTGSKKKKKRKEISLEGEGDVTGSIQEPPDTKPKAVKNEKDLIDSKKQSGKKSKHKDDTSFVNGFPSHNHNNSMASPEKSKEGGGAEIVHECNVEKRESGSTNRKKHKETPDNKKTPAGALAFKRVDANKVSFLDPRLGDNSYWAKDGAEEGYGAKAQEVLGQVQGRDFRHEKTKKKRGSYRGGLIGLQSHSIKFENSDED